MYSVFETLGFEEKCGGWKQIYMKVQANFVIMAVDNSTK